MNPVSRSKLATAAPVHIPAIDGLRAVAVLAVMLFHLDVALLPGGFTGVDVFFVISGYVISHSLARNDIGSLGSFILEFYRRRILRIVPALLFCLVLTSLFVVAFVPGNYWLSLTINPTGLWAFFGLSNFYLVERLDGYFADTVPYNPFAHTWSLAVEEQFYLLFPLIFYVWLRLREQGGRHARTALAVLPLIALLSFAFSAWETQEARQRAFYLLPSRFWELAAGALLYQFQFHRPGCLDRAAHWLLALGGVSLALAFCFAVEARFPFPWALVPVMGTVCLIAGVLAPQGAQTRVGRLLAGPTLVWLGRRSYSLYLWHWPVFVLFRWTVGLTSAADWVAALVLTFLLAAFSYRHVERAFLEGKSGSTQASWKIVAGGAMAICACFLGVKTLFGSADGLGLPLGVEKDACVWRAASDQCEVEPPSAPIDRRLFVIGDSHAEAYSWMVRSAANRLGAEVRIRSLPGCATTALVTRAMPGALCGKFDRQVEQMLDQKARPGDIVFLAALRTHRLSGQASNPDLDEVTATVDSPRQLEVEKQALAEARATIAALRARGLQVLLNAPQPVFRSPTFRCADWFNRHNPACEGGFTVERALLSKNRQPVMAMLRMLEQEQGIHVWDPFPLLCPGATCSAFDGDKPLFYDGDHLSGHGNLRLVESFTRELASLWGLEDGRSRSLSAADSPGAGRERP